MVAFVQGRQSNAQSCCFCYLTYCILDRVPLPSLFRKVPNSSSSCESSKCSLSSHKLQCHVEKKYYVTLSRASYSELNRSSGCIPSGKERFSALRASFWSKNKRGGGGGRGRPGPLSWIRHWTGTKSLCSRLLRPSLGLEKRISCLWRSAGEHYEN